MELTIIDKVGDCPPCKHIELRFDYETGATQDNKWVRQTWVAHCVHEAVCSIRRREKTSDKC